MVIMDTFDEKPMTEKRARHIINVYYNDTYGGYVFDYEDVRRARIVLGIIQEEEL